MALTCLFALFLVPDLGALPPSSGATVGEALWWSLSSDIEPKALRALVESPTASRERYLQALDLGQAPYLGDSDLANLDFYVDGRLHSELVPVWWAFDLLAQDLDQSPEMRSALSRGLTHHGLSEAGSLAVLASAEAKTLRQLGLEEDLEPKRQAAIALVEELHRQHGRQAVEQALDRGDSRALAQLAGRSARSVEALGRAWQERPDRQASSEALVELRAELTEADWLALTRYLRHEQAARLTRIGVKRSERRERLFFAGPFIDLEGPQAPDLWRVSARASATYRCDSNQPWRCPLLGATLISTCYITDEYHDGGVDLPPKPDQPSLWDVTMAHHESGRAQSVHISSPQVTVQCPEVDFDIALPHVQHAEHRACWASTQRGFNYRIWIAAAGTRIHQEILAGQMFWDRQSQCVEAQGLRVTTTGLGSGESVVIDLEIHDEEGTLIESLGGVRSVSTELDYGRAYYPGWTYKLQVLSRPPGKVCFTRNTEGTFGSADEEINIRCGPPIPLAVQVRDLAPGQTIQPRVTVTANGQSRSSSVSASSNGLHFFALNGIAGATFEMTVDDSTCTVSPANGRVPDPPPTSTVTCSGTNQTYTLGVQTDFENVNAAPFMESVLVHLDATGPSGQSLPRQTLSVGPFGSSYQFPQALPAGSSWQMSQGAVPHGSSCQLLNAGPATLAGPVTATLSCLSFPDDWCDVVPELCFEDSTTPVCSTDFEVISLETVTVCQGMSPDDLTCYTYYTAFVRGVTSCLRRPGAEIVGGAESRATVAAGRSETHSVGPIVYLRNRTDVPWSGTIPIFGVARHDQEAVGGIEIYVDGQRVSLSGFQRDLEDPWTCSEYPQVGCDSSSRFVGYLDTTTLNDGVHRVMVKATNADGSAPSLHEISLTVDNSTSCGDTAPPTLGFSWPLAGGAVPLGLTTVQVNASDAGSGIERVELRVNGILLGQDSSAPYTFPWNVSAGSHTLLATAFDGCGNQASREITVLAINPCAGQSAPTVSIPGFTDGQAIAPGRYEFQAQVSGGASQGIDHVEFQVGSFQPHVDHSAPYSTNGYWLTIAGPVQVKATARDACGRSGTKTVNLNVTHSATVCDLDTGPPAVTITNPSNGSSHGSGNISITTSVSDQSPLRAASLWIDGQYVDGSTVLSGDTAAYRWTWPATPGSHDLQVRVQDVCDKIGLSPTIQVQVQ